MSQNVYSTTEQAVGTWIDGKTIYRKVVQCGSIASASKDVAHGISNLGVVVEARGQLISGSSYYPAPRVAGVLAQTVGMNVGPVYIRLDAGGNANFTDSFVIIEYTKTTDQPIN